METTSQSATAEPAAQQGNQAVNDPWREKYKRHWLQLRGLAWDGMMMDKIMRQNAVVMEVAKNAREGTTGQKTEASVGEDEMGVRIGDVVNNNYYQTVGPQAADQPTEPGNPMEPTPTPPQPVAEQPKPKSSLLVPALIAGLLGTGGLAAYQYFKPTPKPPAYIDTDTDRGIKTGVDISTGEPPWGDQQKQAEPKPPKEVGFVS